VNKLKYEYQKPGEPTPDPTVFRIQASSIASYADYTNKWFREKLLGESGFEGSTASVAGTCVHFLAQQFSTNGVVTPEDKEEVYEYIALETSEMVDPDAVRTRITPMWSALKEHLLTNPSSLDEPLVTITTQEAGVVIGGSIDSLVDLTSPGTKYTSLDEVVASGHSFKIVDYKTTSAKSQVAKFSKAYKLQLLTYAKVLKELGVRVTEIELCYITQEHIGEISEKTGKQLKSYPSQVYTLTEAVTDESIEFIESLIKIIAKSVTLFVTKPELRGIIAQDWRLMDHQAQLPFTSIGSTPTEEI
jgi:hypothetical protein